MNKYIIISDKVRSHIDLEGDVSENLIISANLKKDISRLVDSDESHANLIFAVLFLHVKDLDKIDLFLKDQYSYTQIAYRIIIIGSGSELEKIKPVKLQRVSDFRISRIPQEEFNILIKKAFLQIEAFYKYKMRKNEDLLNLMDMRRDQEDLIHIGKSLNTEKDPYELIKLILLMSKKITAADAGSIYIVEQSEDGKKRLRFTYSHTFSRDIPLQEFVMDLNKKSIAGYVAVTGNILNIPDVYVLPRNAPYSHNSSFDQQHNYTTRSMLVVPMRNHIDEIIGVIQLINSKEYIKGNTERTGNEAFEIMLKTPEDFQKKVVAFDERYESLLESVASQAAIAIENNRMMIQIQNQFEEFVKASVSAVESLDTATAGHAFRVSEMCKGMARAVNSEKSGYYKEISFTDTQIRELEYAALLHDFGKVYININIFLKEKKLFPHELDNLILKFNYLYRFVELGCNLKKTSGAGKVSDENRKSSQSANELQLEEIKEIKNKLKDLNEPTIKEDNPEKILSEIQSKIQKIQCYDIDGNKIDMLSSNEQMNLSIHRGSLNPLERKEIESHVTHTFNFVSNIPWPPEFKNIPEIVLNHHEKLDGSGYPNGRKGRESIPVQSRMMAIADIYDALVAADRPYKKALSIEGALSILQEEADRNKLDPDLINIFIKNKIYNIINKNAS